MFIVATVLGIYLENGEAQIQSIDTLPHFEETAVFQSLGECEEYLLSQAKETKLNPSQEIKFVGKTLTIKTNTRDWFSYAQCIKFR